MKRLAFLLIFCLAIGIALPPGTATAANLTDINSHWAKDCINTMVNAGYISGYADGTFKPDKLITHAEFTCLLLRSLDYKPSTSKNIYFKGTGTHWSRGYINKAVELKILIPNEDNIFFKPDTGIKRSEISAMLVRALGKKPDNGKMKFKDSSALNQSAYKGYIKTATDLSLLSAYANGNFEPFQQVTRAQACKVISNLLTLMDKTPEVKILPPDSAQTQTQTQTTTTPTGPTNTIQTFTSIAIGDELYSLVNTPISFKIALNSVPVSSLIVQQDYLYINNQYRYALNTSLKDLDVMINNTRYVVNQISVANGCLVIFPGNRKLASVTVSDHKYDSDFVKLYINSSSTGKYLSDLVVLDQYSVELGGNKYDLTRDKITVELGGTYYNITKFTLSSTGTTPAMYVTDPVITRGYTINSISTIFVGTSVLNISRINSLDFIINGQRYRLSEVNIDRSGNFIMGDKSYPCKDTTMIVDNAQYKVDNISLLQDKLVIYCSTSIITNTALVNSQYHDSTGVKIIKDNVAYELDQVLIISRNVMRISGKQYTLDSTFKVSFDGKTYKLEAIDWDSQLQIPVITSSTSEVTSSQPVKYVFYLGNSIYRDGIGDDVIIYTSSKWITFNQIFISDPSHFTVSGISYPLIGASVKIKNVDFKIIDTAWHGSSQQLDIYLQ